MKLQALQPRLQTLVSERIKPQETERLRGRAAVDRRARWLYLHPLCVECTKEGRVTAGVNVDHVIPLWAGGKDDYETNGQTLCRPHHLAKSAEEAAERARGG